MKKNVDKLERVFRIAVGLAILSLVFVGPETAWGWLGLVALVTGVLGRCPPYALFGIRTCGKNC